MKKTLYELIEAVDALPQENLIHVTIEGIDYWVCSTDVTIASDYKDDRVMIVLDLATRGFEFIHCKILVTIDRLEELYNETVNKGEKNGSEITGNTGSF